MTAVWEGLPAAPHVACSGQEPDAQPPFFIHLQMLFRSPAWLQENLTLVQGPQMSDLGHTELGVASTLLP